MGLYETAMARTGLELPGPGRCPTEQQLPKLLALNVESVVRLIEHDGEALIVAVENGRIVGSVIGAWDGWRGAIYRLAVAPSHRRSGLARRLVADAEDRLRSRGAVRLAAIVVESDPQAVGFWRSSGWEEQTERARFVKG